MQWGPVLIAFIIGASTGGWLSRRKAVAHAYAEGGKAAAAAHAQATGGAVYIGVGPDGRPFQHFQPETVQQLAAAGVSVAELGAGYDGARTDYDDDGDEYAADYYDRVRRRTERDSGGFPGGWHPDLGGSVGNRGAALDKRQVREVVSDINLWGRL